MRDPTIAVTVVLFLLLVAVVISALAVATGCTVGFHYHSPAYGAATSQPADADALTDTWVDDQLRAAIER